MARRKKNQAPDPGWRGRMFQALALSMLFASFFGAISLLDGWFSRRLLDRTEREVVVATTIMTSMFWPCFLVLYLGRVRKSARRREFDWQAQHAEEKRLERVHRALQGRG
jgi:hypothetical protein